MEITIDPMSEKRIVEALKELKAMWFGKSPSKYQFALGYAIRKYDEPPNTQMQIDTKPCPLCHVWKRDRVSNFAKYCGSCGRALRD